MKLKAYRARPLRMIEAFLLTLANKERVRARTVVIASGARYRRLDLENLASFEGSCVHYWASPLEGRLCAGQEVALVGGENSAGQAAVFLSGQVAKVRLIVRGPGLEANMSRYLVERITARPNVEIQTETTVSALEGQDGVLDASTVVPIDPVMRGSSRSATLFVFIGADRNTDWLSRSGVIPNDTGSFSLAQTSTGRSKPTCLAHSRSAMCARVRSSALPQPSERTHRS
jgi:thioredoxin reductase (NADPH)